MDGKIEEAKAELMRAKQRLAGALTSTPDDKKNWSPSATSRTPVQITAHAALSTPAIQELIEGKPFRYGSMQEMVVAVREYDKPFTSAEEVLALLDQNCSAYAKWLDTVTPEALAGTVQMPFGEMPMQVAVTIAADHMRGHAAQIEYLQTVYGDTALHM